MNLLTRTLTSIMIALGIMIMATDSHANVLNSSDVRTIHELSDKAFFQMGDLEVYSLTLLPNAINHSDDRSNYCVQRLGDFLSANFNLGNLQAFVEIDSRMSDHRDELITLVATDKAIESYLGNLRRTRNSFDALASASDCGDNAAFLYKREPVLEMASEIETLLNSLHAKIVSATSGAHP